MSNTITVTIPHRLGLEAAKAQARTRLEKMQRDYVDKIAHSEINWSGDIAHIRVDALGQSATAQVSIFADHARVDVQLPWLFAALSGRVQQIVHQNASEALKIEHLSKKG
jgi:hypothetical protein